MISSETKAEVMKSAQRHKTDTGSTQVQVSVLTERIRGLTGHLQAHKLDQHSRRGLLQMVGRRKRLLGYLRRQDYATYQKLIDKLKLRA